VLLSSGDSFPHLIQKPRSQLGFVIYLLNYLRIKWPHFTTLSFLETTYTDRNFLCVYKVNPSFSNDEFCSCSGQFFVSYFSFVYVTFLLFFVHLILYYYLKITHCHIQSCTILRHAVARNVVLEYSRLGFIAWLVTSHPCQRLSLCSPLHASQFRSERRDRRPCYWACVIHMNTHDLH
jgi:hypothetical protein